MWKVWTKLNVLEVIECWMAMAFSLRLADGVIYELGDGVILWEFDEEAIHQEFAAGVIHHQEFADGVMHLELTEVQKR